MTAIYKKEMRSYFINPVGFVFIGVFLTISAALCAYCTLQTGTYSTGSYFYYLILVMWLLLPLLTMRTFAEEKKMRTEQMLMTAPVSIVSMVMGKFLAAFTMFAGSLLVSCVNFLPLFIIGSVEADLNEDSLTHIGPVPSEIIGSVMGILLIGGVFLAVGIFVSSLTENQLSAAIITIAILAVMIILNLLNSTGSDSEGTRLVGNYVLRYILDWISILSRYTYFRMGILDWSALLYYLSLIFIFVYMTVRVYEHRRWAK